MGGAEEVAKAQQAIVEHSVELFLHRISRDGHVGLSGMGDMILFGEDEGTTRDTTGLASTERAETCGT